MKKDNDLKNINVNEIADIKKIYDGCKFCMETRGRICDKAEELFGNKTVLSQYSPFFNNISGRPNTVRPLYYPVECKLWDLADDLRFCYRCKIVYAERFTTLTCPHCGVEGEYMPNYYCWLRVPIFETK